jgi:DNA-binding response OmpR family regulator
MRGEDAMSDGKRILIVDDEPNIRLVLRTALAAAGHALSLAEDGETALMWLSSYPFDLVLLDLQLPGIGGMEVLESLRATGNDVPVIIITAHGTIHDAVRAMQLGAIDFLTKPMLPDALRAVVAEVLARHAHPAPVGRAHEPPEAVSSASQFAANLARAKQALNRRVFDEAEVFLRQAIALDDGSAEAHNLMGVLHECRNEHDASYREYRAALAADRHHEPARHNIRRYYERFTFGSSNVPVDTGEA